MTVDAERMDGILASITPPRLEALIRDLAAGQAEGNRDGVGLFAIIRAVTRGEDLGIGTTGWERHLRVREAIKMAVAQIEGMRYVEADD